MTLYHFLNCALLTFLPPFIVYKATKLSEYSTILQCLYASLAYIATQLCKIILLATILPYSESEQTTFDLTQEVFKALVGFGDVLGVFLIMNYVRLNISDLKILAVGLGWATGESFVMRLAPLWIGARGNEFDWSYIVMAVESNISLVLSIAFVGLVWLWSRKNLNTSTTKVLPIIVSSYCALPLVISFLRLSLGFTVWVIIIAQLAFTVMFSLVSYYFYTTYMELQTKSN